jgi:hypothetical protein
MNDGIAHASAARVARLRMARTCGSAVQPVSDRARIGSRTGWLPVIRRPQHRRSSPGNDPGLR